MCFFFVYANEKIKLKKELVHMIVLQQIEVLAHRLYQIIDYVIFGIAVEQNIVQMKCTEKVKFH